MNGTEMIAAERQRQVTVEGWTDEHDDSHSNADPTRAALCYADKAARQITGTMIGGPRPSWPWAAGYWKPAKDDPIRNLVKAGALIAAEIDRLLRAQQPASEPTP